MRRGLGRRTCRTGLMPGAEMPHLPLKQLYPRSLSASSVSSFSPQFAGLTGASLLTGLFRIRGTPRRPKTGTEEMPDGTSARRGS